MSRKTERREPQMSCPGVVDRLVHTYGSSLGVWGRGVEKDEGRGATNDLLG